MWSKTKWKKKKKKRGIPADDHVNWTVFFFSLMFETGAGPMLLKKGVTTVLSWKKTRKQKKQNQGVVNNAAVYWIKATKKKGASRCWVHGEFGQSHSGRGFRALGGEKESAGQVFKTSVLLHLKAASARSVFVVGLLLARAGDAVLWLGGARAQAVQAPAVLGVVDVVLKEKLKEPRVTTESFKMTRILQN